MKSSWSLERRLVRRMALTYAGLVLASGAVLLVALWFAGLARDQDGRSTSRIIAESLVTDASGRLSIRRSTNIDLIFQSDPSFWAVARDAQGREASIGHAPPEARVVVAQSALPENAGRATIWTKADADDPDWSLFRRPSSAGPVIVAVKVGRVLTWPELIGLIGLAWIALALPIAGIPALLAVPFLRLVIRRTLRPLSSLAKQAGGIDVEQRTVRLSHDDAPGEARPLVEAVNAAIDRLDEGYTRQAQFLADAAHELRTPIAVLQTRLDGAPRDTLNDGLRRDADRLASLAEQLLALQQLEMTRLDQQPIDLSIIARNLVADFAPMIINRRRTIAFEGDMNVRIRGDQLAIERALGNLVQNAVEHGGPNIVLNVTGTAITVKDDGQGVPVKEQDSIFEPFHRLRPRHAGAGLGLALVRQIVRQHGGTVSIDSDRDSGFAITLHFPSVEASHAL